MIQPAKVTLAELPSFDYAVHPERTVREAFDLLEANPLVPAVMVAEEGRFITALSRAGLLELMRRRFSYELYWERPLTEVLSRWTIEPTVLDASTTVDEAVAAALTRPADALSEPLVCRDDRGRHAVVDMHTVLAAQCGELALANEQLAEAGRASEVANRAKTEFLANMSHEIRTPMSAILGYAEVLQEGEIDPAQRAAAVRTIRRSGEHLLSLLNDILDLSKIEAGRLEVDPMDHDAVALVRETVELFRHRAGEKGVELRLEVDAKVPARIRTDPTRLRQIVSNLLGNAVKFTAAGRVVVSVSIDHLTTGSLLTVSVEDTGIGISPQSLAGLFQPFVQADASMSRRFGGSGLGLTISRKLARMLGGDLVATSVEGRGSCFVATVSAGLDRVTSGPGWAVAQPASTAGPLDARILIAEDGDDNQRLFRFHLTRAGATVDLASDGVQAVAKAFTPGVNYDLVLMDMQMPGMDGYEATRTLRLRGYSGPILALTAHAMAADRERAIAAGCDDYLTKPIARDALIAACFKWTNDPLVRRAA